MANVPNPRPRREVFEMDAFAFLDAWHNKAGAVTAVLPDAAEVDMDHAAWRLWFLRAIRACADAVDGPVVFQQTDRLYDGQWIDKSVLVAEGMQGSGRTLTWHKIALRRDPGAIDLHRPTYSHVLAYGGRPGTRTPDVIHSGRPLWRDGIGRNVAAMIMFWIYAQGVTTVLNPFCGRGTLLAAANEQGMNAVGCDLDRERINIARTVTITSAMPFPT